MLLGLERKFLRRADIAQNDIGLCVRPDRHLGRGRVRNGREQVSQLIVEPLLVSLTFLNCDLERSDLRHEALGPLLVLARFGLADFLGGCIARGLSLLQFLNRRAALLVKAENSIQRGARACLEAAISQPFDEGLRIVADPFDVEHGRSSLNRRLRIRPYYRLVIAGLTSSWPGLSWPSTI